MPRVAVLTPVYNGAAFLRETMASVQAQTYPNLVHFVLDNASTDATPDILREFRAGRVPVVVRRNDALLPIGENWNKCVRLGSDATQYFRILCADDTMPPDSIEKMVALAEADESILMVGCQRLTPQDVEEFGWDRSRFIFEGREAARACMLGKTGFAPPHLMYRSSVLTLRHDFFYDKIIAFDTEAAFFILSQPKARFGFIHEPLGFTRRHKNSITATVASVMHTQYFDWLIVIRRYGHCFLAPDELRKYALEFRRHYLGRLLTWRFRFGNKTAFEWHKKSLRSVGEYPKLRDYWDAVCDYCLRKLGRRAEWDRYPRG